VCVRRGHVWSSGLMDRRHTLVRLIKYIESSRINLLLCFYLAEEPPGPLRPHVTRIPSGTKVPLHVPVGRRWFARRWPPSHKYIYTRAPYVTLYKTEQNGIPVAKSTALNHSRRRRWIRREPRSAVGYLLYMFLSRDRRLCAEKINHIYIYIYISVV